MAKGKYQKLYEARMKRLGKDKNKSDDLQRQINNYKTRLEAGGVKNPGADDRNGLEKLLNLEQNQGLIKDIFEILGRPQQAIFTGIKNSQEGGSFLEGAKEGITGNEETQFKDILMNTGNFEDEKGKLNAVDVLGFAGDVFLDPLDLALIPVTGGASLAVGAVDTAGDVAKAAKAVDTVSDVAKAADAVSDVAKATDAASNVSKTVKLKSVNDLLFEGAGKLAKKGVKSADNLIEKGLLKLDNAKGITYLDNTAKSAANLGKTVEEGSEYANKLGSLETYKSIKETLSKTFKVPQKVRDAVFKTRGSDVDANMADFKLRKLKEDELVKPVENFIENQAKKEYSNVDEVLSDVSRFGEYTMDRSMTNGELIRYAKKGELEGKQEYIDAINNMVKKDVPNKRIKELNAKYKNALEVRVNDKGYIELGKGFDEIELDTAGKTIVAKNYTPEQQEKINHLIEKYKTNEDGFADLVDNINGTAWKKAESSTPGISKYEEIFGKAYEGVDDIKLSVFDKANLILDDLLGTDFNSKYHPLDNSDYVLPHTLTEAAQELKGNPIAEKLLNRRKHIGSVDEINNYAKELFKKIPKENLTEGMQKFINSGSDFMETSILKAFDNRYLGEKGLVGSVSKNKVASEILLDVTFSDFDKSKKLRTQLDNAYKNGESAEVIGKIKKEINELEGSSVIKYLSKNDKNVPSNFVQVDRAKLSETISDLEKSSNRYGNEDIAKQLKKIRNDIVKNKSNIAMDKDVARMLGVVSNKETVNGLQSLYNSYLNVFKKWKTASPTFIMNAFFGNTSNLALSGISPLDQAKYGPKVADIMQNGEKYYKMKLSGEILDSSKDEIAELWYNYQKMGFSGASFKLNELPEDMQKALTGQEKYKNTASKVVNFVPHMNSMINDTFDTSGRITVMLKALDDPSYMERLGTTNVYDTISKVMFDPTMVTSGEKSIKNIIPFYTYSKNNLVFQATNLFKNPTKYSRTLKAMESLQKSATGDNEEYMADYIKNSLYIPIPSLDENGNYTVLRASLPFGQLIETVDDPLQASVDALSPAIKAPIEYATNVDSFTGREIEKFPGEKSSQIPFLTKKQQKLIGDLSGLDVPLKTGYRLATDPASAFTMQQNVDTDKINRQYEEIEELQTLMKQYEQEGYKFSTMNELKKANKNSTVAGLNSIFSKYDIDQKTYRNH